MNSIMLHFQSGSAMVLLFCAFQLTMRKNRNAVNLSLAGLYFSLSSILFSFWVFGSGNAAHFRYLLYQDNSAAMLIGPCVYLYLVLVTGGKKPDPRLYALNFIPSVLCFAGTLHEDIANGRLQTFRSAFEPKLPGPEASPFIYFADFLSSIHVFAYIIVAILAIAPVFSNTKHRAAKELRFVLVYMLFIACFITGVVITGLMNRQGANLVFLYLLLASGIIYFIFSVNYPEFAYNAMNEGRRIRADNNPVDEHNAAAIMERMETLMREERIFTNENLTLGSAAERVGVTPHLLSKVLNGRVNANLRTYLNTWRVDEAKRMLLSEQSVTVLEIAYKTGFNSKSAFNDTFLKMTGATPRGYRAGKKQQPC